MTASSDSFDSLGPPKSWTGRRSRRAPSPPPKPAAPPPPTPPKPVAATPPPAPPPPTLVLGPASRPARLLVRDAALRTPAPPLLDDDPTVLAYLDRLTSRNHFPDAVRFLAHALPRRDAVCWACVCGFRANGGKPTAVENAALEAGMKWAAEPTEERRQHCQAVAEAADVASAAGCAAMAAYWSIDDSGAWLTARAAAGSVLLAAGSWEPERLADHFREFLRQGRRLLLAAEEASSTAHGRVLPTHVP